MAKPNKNSKPAPVAAKPALDPHLATELEGLKLLTAKAVRAEGEATVVADFDASVNALTLTRALLKDTDAERKERVDEAVPQTVKDALKAIETEAKALKKGAEALEAQLAAALTAEVEAQRLTESMTTVVGCQLILQHRKALVIDDEAQLPAAFTVPNFAKIEAALTEWGTRCEAAKLLDLPPPACPVPGAHIGTKIVLVTKAPDLIEE